MAWVTTLLEGGLSSNETAEYFFLMVYSLCRLMIAPFKDVAAPLPVFWSRLLVYICIYIFHFYSNWGFLIGQLQVDRNHIDHLICKRAIGRPYFGNENISTSGMAANQPFLCFFFTTWFPFFIFLFFICLKTTLNFY